MTGSANLAETAHPHPHPLKERDWPDLVARFDGLMGATARRYGLTRHEAEEAGQRTWAKVVERGHQVREEARFPGWFSTVARRECIAVRRERWTTALSVDPTHLGWMSGEPMPCEVAIRKERCQQLRLAVAALPSRERQLIEALLAPTEPSYAEVAAQLAMPIGSIGPIRRRALNKLRVALATAND